MIIQNYYNNANQVLKEQLTGISKVTIQRQNQYLDYLIDPSFQGEVNRLFVLSFQNNVVRTGHTRYFIFQA